MGSHEKRADLSQSREHLPPRLLQKASAVSKREHVLHGRNTQPLVDADPAEISGKQLRQSEESKARSHLAGDLLEEEKRSRHLPPGDLGRSRDLTNSEGPTPVDQTSSP